MAKTGKLTLFFSGGREHPPRPGRAAPQLTVHCIKAYELRMSSAKHCLKTQAATPGENARWRFLPVLAAALALAAAGSSQATPPLPPSNPAWSPWLEFRRDSPEFTPVSMALDESGTIHVLEAAREENGAKRRRARIRVWKNGNRKPPATFAEGFTISNMHCRPALLAWRGCVYVADSPRILVLEGRNGDARTEAAPIEVSAIFHPASGGGGFGGLVPGPDGRIYGAFGGGTTKSDGEIAARGVVFRFEPDGSGFEIVERGLNRPSAPLFDDFGMAVLLDIRNGGQPVLAKLLDGSTAPPNFSDAKPLDFGEKPLGSAALSAPDGSGGLALVGPANAPRVAWWTRDGSKTPPHCGIFPADQLPPDAKLLDLAADWNGRAHLLLSRPGKTDASTPRFQVLAFGKDPASPQTSKKQLQTLSRYFSNPEFGPVSELSDMLQSPERRIRIAAQLALTRHPKAFAQIKQTLNSTDLRTRLHALWAAAILARRGSQALIPGDDSEFAPIPSDKLARSAAQIIVRSLDSPDLVIRIQSLRALAAAPEAAARLVPFRKLIEDPAPEIRDESLLAAARMAWRQLLPALSAMRRSGKPPELDPARVADALAATYSPPRMRVFAYSPDPLLRLAAVEALRRTSSPYLGEFFRDPDPRISGSAVHAASRSASPETKSLAAKILFDKPWPPSWDVATCRALIHCAESSNKPNLVPRLTQLANQSGPAAKAAAETLEKIKPK
jgi:hypothetical protein